MPLNKLDNFIKNTEGRILYVSPSDLDSSDSISNEGNSLARPFKTLQRALIESARFSYVKGRSNDIVEKTTILLMPGEHTVDNRPGLAIYNDSGTAKVRVVSSSGTGTNATAALNLDLNTNFDISQENNILYKFNSVDGGVVVPRGTSIVGLDLRKTKIRPKYVPNPTDSNVPKSALFRITGSCYFWQFSIFDGNDLELVYTDQEDFTSGKQASPTFSHHKLTVFEYCDGVNKVTTDTQSYELTDLDMYYAKVGNAYNEGSGRLIEPTEKYPSDPLAFEPQRPEYEIVGAFATDPLTLTSIRAGDASGVTSTVTVFTSKPHNFQVGTPIKIRGVTPTAYNISAIVSYVSDTDDKVFTYTLPNPDLTLSAGNVAAATVTIETDTVSGASPYIFNCSMRSVYGMNGLNADGDKATGFKSMVVAQFTGVSLQKDDRAFAKYDITSRSYNAISISAKNGAELSGGSSSSATGQAYHLDSGAVYRQGWETTHINIVNDGILQIVSVFAIGYARHFTASSGSDASITNSNSNFGQLSLIADGFKKTAFDKDNNAFVTAIIPPRSIESVEEDIDWIGIDTSKGTNTKLYVLGYNNVDIKPPVITQGYRVGARLDDKLYVNVGVSTYQASIVMPTYNISSTKKYVVTTSPSGSDNFFTIGNHDLSTGEKVIVISDDADLPENIKVDTVYYAITSSTKASLLATQIELATSKTNATEGSEITVSGGKNCSIISRVSDKTAGELKHPVQWDDSVGVKQWYITTSDTNNTIFSNLSKITPDDIPFFRRTEDVRSLDEKVYKLRVVIPRELPNAKNPENGFVIQDSSTTGARSDADFNLVSTLTKNDYNFKKNPGFISTCTKPSVGLASITTELPHTLKTGDLVTIKNVTDSINGIGLGNSGYNGTYPVTVLNDMQFTYQPTSSFGNNSTNNINSRTTSLPRFERNDWQSNLYVYRNEVIAEYIEGLQDGVYHIYPLSADYKVNTEFTEYEYSQNIVNLYPQTDRDNVDVNPRSAKSFALRSPIGDVETNDLKKSITRESIDKLNIVTGIGVTISSVSSTSNAATITFDGRHNFCGIQTGQISNAGGSYPQNGTFYNVKLRSGSTTGTWQGATAKVVVGSGAIQNVTIQSPGAGYTDTNGGTNLYFDETYLGSPGVTARYRIRTTGYSPAINNIIQITGIGLTSDGYYRITSVPNDTQISIAKSSGDPIIIPGQYAYSLGSGIPIAGESYSDGISTWNCDSAHGLVAGNSFRIIDNSNNLHGPYIVRSRIDVDSFDSITSHNFSGINNGYIVREGLGPNEKVSDITDENLDTRSLPIYGNDTAFLNAAASSTSSTIQLNIGIGTARFPYGSYIQIDEEMMRIASPLPAGSGNILTVVRGVLATDQTAHDNGSLVRSVKPYPIEFRRPSILRASGHTFEYLGYGPGNYSTALPQVQTKTLTEREEFLSQSQEKSGGIVVYTGMNNKGDFYIGNQKKSSATGEEVTFDTPVPTVTGENPSRLSVVFDEVTVKERIIVEGGDSSQVLSEFDGPTTFNNTVKINNKLNITGDVKSTSGTQSNGVNSGSFKIEGGVGIKKNVHIGGTLNVGGTLTGAGATFTGDLYATNVSASSSVTANKFYGDISSATGFTVPGGNIGTCFYGDVKCEFGGAAGADTLEIYKKVSNKHSYISHTDNNSSLFLQSENNIVLENTDGSNYINCKPGAGIELYYDGTKRLETTGTAESSPKDYNGVYITGQLKVSSNITAYETSDATLKDNLSKIPDAVEKIKSIRGYTFDWNEKAKGIREGHDIGVIAQEVEKLNLPGLVTTREDGTLAVKYEKLVPILIEAVRELSETVDVLQGKVCKAIHPDRHRPKGEVVD